MEYDCDNCKRMRTGDCAGLIRSCQGFVPLQRVEPEILKSAQEAYDDRMHKGNYYSSRNTQKRAEAVKQADNVRDQHEREAAHSHTERGRHEQRKEQEPIRPATVREDAVAALRVWRKAQAQAESLPAYCVFPDTTLKALASAEIQTKADLLTVRGIGARLYEKYGDDLFRILSTYPRLERKEMTEQNYADALKHTLRNKDEIQKSKMCACFYCKMVFSSYEAYWFDSDDSAHCPYCDQTTIIGDASGFPITDRTFMAEVKRSAYRR